MQYITRNTLLASALPIKEQNLYLGIVIDQTFSLKPHIDSVIPRIRKIYNDIKVLYNFLLFYWITTTTLISYCSSVEW